MSLEQLDAFLVHARQTPALASQLAEPLELPTFLDLARGAGYSLDEADVIAAQQRQEASLSDAELQERAGVEGRRLRNFILA
ncbi:Nif11-like leader peptide family RiPP precursor [Cyanobium sp. FACHB-13342]|uniref:Nif11-like leader peptide family RiPP precursor n=1 Tax=Cyanobium sp. FACHB-13342 TaxID=2692793 RepID=UPI0016816974|nr:Nif11-like leader peptide family RiPP precursor [Cyanobium sp. FACHB-13342]MBD2423463.1 Nif11-like leader peptide family natural product precursor [Cyanobium sp. FACHB-13342]